MKNTLEYFEEQKKQALDILKQLVDFVHDGEDLGVSIHPELVKKIKNAIANVKDEKLKVALVGGFSEGKTSIAAAWLERLDRQSMNISQQESSSEVSIYDFENRLQIIDTPGLFGFKEKTNASTDEIEKFKDITKRYVSEAHLVLYVMNSTNPIKESHAEDLRWLFRTLNLLPRTVFVLSRFDEVADVEDDLDFQEKLAIKKNSVLQRLDHVLSFTPEERAQVSVVAVSANPFDMGAQHWLAHLDTFRRISRIKDLQLATNSKIEGNGGTLAIVNETKKTIISDVISKQLPAAKAAYNLLQQEAFRMNKIKENQSLELQGVFSKINNSKVVLRGRVIRYFQDLQLQAKNVGVETFDDFLHREIGSEGILINQRVQEIFNDEVDSIVQDLNRIQININNEINHFNDMVTAVGKQGIKYLAKPGVITNQTVLIARDGINAVAKIFGADISKFLKFKPWGATKLANGLASAAAFVGIAFELWDSYQEKERVAKFKEGIDQLVKNLEKQQNEIVNLIDSSDFASTFFPSFDVLNNQLSGIEVEMVELHEKHQRFKKWYETGETIDVDFRELQPAGTSHFEKVPTIEVDIKPFVSTIEEQKQLTLPKRMEEDGKPFWKRMLS